MDKKKEVRFKVNFNGSILPITNVNISKSLDKALVNQIIKKHFVLVL